MDIKLMGWDTPRRMYVEQKEAHKKKSGKVGFSEW